MFALAKLSLAAVALLVVGMTPIVLTQEMTITIDGDTATSALSSEQSLREKLARGITRYRKKDTNGAAQAFNEALSAKPDDKILYEFKLAVGDEEWKRMKMVSELASPLEKVENGHDRHRVAIRKAMAPERKKIEHAFAEKVTIDFQEVTLVDVAKNLSALTGVNFTVDKVFTGDASPKVTSPCRMPNYKTSLCCLAS